MIRIQSIAAGSSLNAPQDEK